MTTSRLDRDCVELSKNASSMNASVSEATDKRTEGATGEEIRPLNMATALRDIMSDMEVRGYFSDGDSDDGSHAGDCSQSVSVVGSSAARGTVDTPRADCLSTKAACTVQAGATGGSITEDIKETEPTANRKERNLRLDDLSRKGSSDERIQGGRKTGFTATTTLNNSTGGNPVRAGAACSTRNGAIASQNSVFQRGKGPETTPDISSSEEVSDDEDAWPFPLVESASDVSSSDMESEVDTDERSDDGRAAGISSVLSDISLRGYFSDEDPQDQPRQILRTNTIRRRPAAAGPKRCARTRWGGNTAAQAGPSANALSPQGYQGDEELRSTEERPNVADQREDFVVSPTPSFPESLLSEESCPEPIAVTSVSCRRPETAGAAEISEEDLRGEQPDVAEVEVAEITVRSSRAAPARDARAAKDTCERRGGENVNWPGKDKRVGRMLDGGGAGRNGEIAGVARKGANHSYNALGLPGSASNHVVKSPGDLSQDCSPEEISAAGMGLVSFGHQRFENERSDNTTLFNQLSLDGHAGASAMAGGNGRDWSPVALTAKPGELTEDRRRCREEVLCRRRRVGRSCSKWEEDLIVQQMLDTVPAVEEKRVEAPIKPRIIGHLAPIDSSRREILRRDNAVHQGVDQAARGSVAVALSGKREELSAQETGNAVGNARKDELEYRRRRFGRSCSKWEEDFIVQQMLDTVPAVEEKRDEAPIKPSIGHLAPRDPPRREMLRMDNAVGQNANTVARESLAGALSGKRGELVSTREPGKDVGNARKAELECPVRRFGRARSKQEEDLIVQQLLDTVPAVEEKRNESIKPSIICNFAPRDSSRREIKKMEDDSIVQQMLDTVRLVEENTEDIPLESAVWGKQRPADSKIQRTSNMKSAAAITEVNGSKFEDMIMQKSFDAVPFNHKQCGQHERRPTCPRRQPATKKTTTVVDRGMKSEDLIHVQQSYGEEEKDDAPLNYGQQGPPGSPKKKIIKHAKARAVGIKSQDLIVQQMLDTVPLPEEDWGDALVRQKRCGQQGPPRSPGKQLFDKDSLAVRGGVVSRREALNSKDTKTSFDGVFPDVETRNLKAGPQRKVKVNEKDKATGKRSDIKKEQIGHGRNTTGYDKDDLELMEEILKDSA